MTLSMPLAAGKRFFSAFLLIAPLFFIPTLSRAQSAPIAVFTATLSASISPAQADMLDGAIAAAKKGGAALLILRLDTPGGGIEPMRRMVTSILGSPVPIVIWIAPSGARAASAGVFLVAAASVAAMAPDTTIGSASPVGPGGGDLGKTLHKKIKNDLESLVRGMALSHGRNAKWYQRFVANAENLTAAEAVRERVVDFIAVDQLDLLTQIGKRGIESGGKVLRFSPDAVVVTAYDPGWRYGVLTWLLDPQVAYILLLIGVAGLFFELTTPGAILPGVIGGLCILPALYALSILPTNVTGLLLLLFGGGLFLLELHVTSYGLLSVAGVAALFTGSMLLFRHNGHPGLPLSVIAPTVAGVSLILLLAGWIVAKAQRQKPRSGLEALVGQIATVRHFTGKTGKVFVNGEIWNATLDARCVDCRPQPGQSVHIVAAKGMTLVVSTEEVPPTFTENR
ncbi:protein of unknown function DUF107 [Solidesulfovibrio fructosivorans JJ]]|uniref:Uncharacterized protein n=1 Tax=Solidesulfovibrio fructosivorans JJ] TaxID=596151 RepID=E1JVC0_SOLFR|nr:nodulation protein NfeD [Solidesulfovibrio fructosivorans]EFL51714.1 protein of unknown function DUF107 [Solidesulfovibrio fructosivorans JJ]]